MIDTFSLLLAHGLIAFVAIRMLLHPHLNEEPARSDRHFKTVFPTMVRKQHAGVETGEARPGSRDQSQPQRRP